jgi:DNA-binding response OmpR family regulator
MDRKVKVLIAEDDPAIAKLVRLLCEHEGYEVTTASDGQSAVDHAASAPFDVILLDTKLPCLDGLSAARRLRSNTETSHLPIIFVSAMAHPDDRARMRSAGADEIIIKPFSNRELLARIRHHLER